MKISPTIINLLLLGAPLALAGCSTVVENEAPENLADHHLERRAVEAVIWGMPAVNYELMSQAMSNAGGDFNQIVFWSRLPDWKNQTLTPNPDSIYAMPFYDVKSGPMVLEIPPADDGTIVGSVDDCWQTALEDVGPAGVDQGKGGKYLILPPGYTNTVPDGYFPLPSSTYRGFALLRSIPKSSSDADVATAVAYAKRIKFYPYSQTAHPPETKFVDAIDVVFDSTIPYNLKFYESLNRVIQTEPWLKRDKAMIDPLKTIGIEKDKPFSPDAATQEVLKRAVKEAHLWLETQYESSFTPFTSDARWAVPAPPELLKALATDYADPNSYPVDARGLLYSFAFFSAKHLGEGQFYLMTIKDKAGDPFIGANTYRLTVPSNAPVSLYWSATAYDRATHALIRGQKWSSRASTTTGLQPNADGSVDIYFGPKSPDGKESNWIPTSEEGEFEVLFRFYGPEKPLFDKTWKLPDIEEVKKSETQP